MQAACHDSGGTIIALCYADHGGSSEQTERCKSFGLFMSASTSRESEVHVRPVEYHLSSDQTA
jgi:hypothetical protein